MVSTNNSILGESAAMSMQTSTPAITSTAMSYRNSIYLSSLTGAGAILTTIAPSLTHATTSPSLLYMTSLSIETTTSQMTTSSYSTTSATSALDTASMVTTTTESNIMVQRALITL